MECRALTRGEILAGLDRALAEDQLRPFYQPQYDHTTGALVGAEALVRWEHPECGLQLPATFVPVLEETGEIVRVDLCVFSRVCDFQRRCLDAGSTVVPVSVNVSRVDLETADYIDRMEAIREAQGVPTQYLRVEITESAAGRMQLVRDAVARFHQLGYLVEMDDFGSGFSSLNVLKDIEFDIIKLDMNFLSGVVGGRGGTIISAVIRMAKWLGTPVIAEGVETRGQADYMASIGCSCVQGYLYARPMPERDFRLLAEKGTVSDVRTNTAFIETMDARRFWSPESLETLIFSNYVGGAAIFSRQGERLEMLRVNAKYIKEIGMNLTAEDVLKADPLAYLDESNRRIFFDMLDRATSNGGEEECETWRDYESDCCGTARLCIRTGVRMLGHIDGQSLFFASIRNITQEKQRFREVSESDRRFRAASEQANVYAWEYTVATREMRPCFRCMRDLGLPPLVRNYPEPAIEAGIFPPDYADMYRDWHRQIAAGVPKLEAIIPLTVSRVPFIVRYTTEFDAAGRPVKAYGSATLVVDNEAISHREETK